MADELAPLRTAKAALNEGLITPQDYDVVKVAFLKAQQLKAGLDAGLVRQQDHDKARDSYLSALDFQMMSTMPSATTNTSAGGSLGAAPAAAPAPPPTAPAAAYAAAPPRPPAVVASAAAAAATTAALASAHSHDSASNGGQLGRVGSGSGAGGGAGGGASMRSPPDSALVIPDLPKYTRGATVGKKSMAGIAVREDCVDLFTHIKTRSAYRWATFKVDSTGREVVIDAVGARAGGGEGGGGGGGYGAFCEALPERECRYGVYDYEYSSADRGTFHRLVFVSWAPDNAPIKTKMMYASTKDFFKAFCDGVGAELQATDRDELAEEEMRDRVVSGMTRK
jgi:cofilin